MLLLFALTAQAGDPCKRVDTPSAKSAAANPGSWVVTELSEEAGTWELRLSQLGLSDEPLPAGTELLVTTKRATFPVVVPADAPPSQDAHSGELYTTWTVRLPLTAELLAPLESSRVQQITAPLPTGEVSWDFAKAEARPLQRAARCYATTIPR